MIIHRISANNHKISGMPPFLMPSHAANRRVALPDFPRVGISENTLKIESGKWSLEGEVSWNLDISYPNGLTKRQEIVTYIKTEAANVVVL